MALFLEVHDLDGADPESVVSISSGLPHVSVLKHWLCDKGRAVALLVEAPDRESLLVENATEITELFAPAERWFTLDSIEVSR